jgi:hypothetical protein
MKLTTLKIHHYRGARGGAELAFSPSLNLVLGDNGSGRTMLLELISTVLGSDFSGLQREEFSLEYGLSLAGVEIQATVRNTKRVAALALPAPAPSALLSPGSPEPAAELEPYVELALQLEAPATRLVLRADAQGVSWEVEGRPAYSQSMQQWSLLDRSLWVLLHMTAPYLEREVRERLKPLLRRTFLLSPSRFDESLGTYEQIGHIRYAMELRGKEVFPFGLMALPTWLPGRLRERVEQERQARAIDIRHDEVERGFLERFVSLAGLGSGRLRVEVLEEQALVGGRRVELGRFGFHFTRADGSALEQAHLSYGHKRLLSFLYYLDVNEDFVIADELACGLQPRWVEACVREVGTRQVFLTSHNPLLYAYVPADAARFQGLLAR